MKLPKAFPKASKLQNLKRFQRSPIQYMKDATQELGSPLDLNVPIGKFGLLTHPDHIQHVLVTNHENYVKSDGYKQVALLLGNGLLTAEGKEWHDNRKALQPSFHKTELKKLLPAVWATGKQYIQALGNVEKLRLDTEMSGLTLTILLNSLIHSEDEEILIKMSEHLTFGQEFIVDRIRNPIKWPLWLPFKSNRQYHHMIKDSNLLIQKAIEDRQTSNKKDIKDLLTTLLENHDSISGFTQIRDEVLTFLVAGHKTSALGMAWGLHLLAHHPAIQERMFEEVKDLADLDDIDLLNYSNLKYTSNVVKEILRYYPPIWNIVRKANEPDNIDGVDIPKGHQMMLSIYELHRHPDFWENPTEFNPDRFLAMKSFHKFQYLPFGGGPRFCIGNNFALYEMMLLLVQFVRNYRLLPHSPKEIRFNPLLTLRPDQPIEVRLHHRSNSESQRP